MYKESTVSQKRPLHLALIQYQAAHLKLTSHVNRGVVSVSPKVTNKIMVQLSL